MHHGSTVVSTVTSHQDVSWFEPQVRHFFVELACFPCSYVGSPQVLCLLPIAQRHAC